MKNHTHTFLDWRIDMGDGMAVSRAVALQERTKGFALRVIRLYREMPKSEEGRIIGKQLLRSGTSVAANYRAVGRARSRKELISKMNVVLEEADESVFWMELLVEAQVVTKAMLAALLGEGNEL